MPAPHEITLSITVNSFRSASSGELLFAVELRRKDFISQLQTFPSRGLAETRAAQIARKLSALLEAGIDLLD